MKENFEKYIKDLPEELQEKARQCRSMEELNGFIAENDLEIPEEALEMVSGGCGGCDHSNATVEKWWFQPAKFAEEPLLNGELVYFIEMSKCTKCGGNAKYTGHTHKCNIELTEAQYNGFKNGYRYVYCPG